MRVVQQRNEPKEQRRIKIRKRHAAEVRVGPTEGVRKDRLIVNLSDREVTRTVDRSRTHATNDLEPDKAGKRHRQ